MLGKPAIHEFPAELHDSFREGHVGQDALLVQTCRRRVPPLQQVGHEGADRGAQQGTADARHRRDQVSHAECLRSESSLHP